MSALPGGKGSGGNFSVQWFTPKEEAKQYLKKFLKENC